MRDRFHQQLDRVVDSVVGLIGQVEDAVSLATRALLDADRVTAESVISNDLAIDDLCRKIEDDATELLLREQPVASDLRLLLVTQRIVADLERSGDLAKNIAKQARRRYPNKVVPQQMEQTIAEMAAAAGSLLRKASQIFAERDLDLARELEADDDRVDDLHRALLREVVASTGSGAVEAAVDLTLCGRYYERIADHAVVIAHQVIYLSTGDHA
jgi:phosphate transport system protein